MTHPFKALFATTVLFAASACVVETEDASTIELHDPQTGELVGYKDLDTAEYVLFDRTDAVDGPVIRIPEEQIEREWIDATVDAKSFISTQTAAPCDLSTYGSLSDPDKYCMTSNGSSCWSMSSYTKGQSVSCDGCCTNKGSNTWSCWEQCSDSMWSGGSLFQ